MSQDPAYTTPAAFRRALTDRLRALARSSRWDLPQLQRHIAYDRLLERLYRVNGGWIVKGATALLARDIGVRGTKDIDLYLAETRAVAEADLRTAAAMDIGDWFSFQLGAPQVLSDQGGGTRFSVEALIGPAPWAQFHVDLIGTDLRMTGEPDHVPALARLDMPDIDQHGYQAYPIVDHVADKVCATLESHGDSARPSTRFKDLVDLVAIVLVVSVSARDQMAALQSEAARRDLELPPRFAVPDRELWERAYAAEVRRSLLTEAQTMDAALDIVKPFLDPLLSGKATGTWRPSRRDWS